MAKVPRAPDARPAGPADRVRSLLKDIDRVSAAAESAANERQQLTARAERAEKAVEILTGEREAVRAVLRQIREAGVAAEAAGEPASRKAPQRAGDS